MGIQPQRLVLCQHTHGINAGIDAVAQWKIDDAVLSSEGYGRLGHLGSQHTQSAALSTGKEHCYHFLSNHVITSRSCSSFIIIAYWF